MVHTENQYLYYAFISYKRADSRYAKWLQRKLQNYRLPAKIRNAADVRRIRLDGGSGAPERLSPIFRDQTDLIPGKLSESLSGALAKSRYLIVLCSREAACESTYLDMELRAFLESGHTPDQVIPLIVDPGCAHPEQECFPAALKALNEQNELLGANVGDSGRNDAFLKVVATMLGLQMAEVKNLDQIRRRKNRIAAVFAAAAVFALCAFAGIYAWQHLITHTEYYENYIVVDNVAQGVSPIDENSISDYSHYYRFTILDGKVREVEYLNYAGTLCPPTATVFNDGAARFSYTYTESGSLYTASYYSYEGMLLTCYQYSEDLTHVTLLQDTVSGETGFSYSSSSEAGATFSDHTSISKYIQTYDENGRLLTRIFAYGDNYAPCADEDHIFGYSFSYDDQGNVTAMAYLGTADGGLTGNLDGVYVIRYTRDTKNGKVLSEALYDRNGNITDGSEGWAYKIYTYTDSSGVESISYYNSLYEPVPCTDGYAQIIYRFDGAVCVGEAYFDVNGNPVAAAEGCASMQYTPNESGQIIFCAYFDEDGNPCTNTDGVYGYTLDIVSDTEWFITYLDEDGTPLENTYGYAIQHIYADEYSYPLEVYYCDSAGAPCTGHYASCTYVYADTSYHSLLEWRFFDADGAPVIVQVTSSLSGAALIMEYNSMGIMTRRSSLDENGDLYEGCGGYACFTYEYENSGGMITEVYRYYDRDLNPVELEGSGSFGAKYICDEAGRVIEAWYLDADDSLMLNSVDGYAGIVYTYDEYDRIASVTYYNERKLPMLIREVARVEMTHDAYGNTLSIWNYGTDLLPVVTESDGYAGVTFDYDEYGNACAMWYYGADGLPMVNEVQGYAGIAIEYNANGDAVKISVYGAEDGEFVLLYEGTP